MVNITFNLTYKYQTISIDIDDLTLNKLELIYKAIRELQKEAVKYESNINHRSYWNNEHHSL